MAQMAGDHMQPVGTQNDVTVFHMQKTAACYDVKNVVAFVSVRRERSSRLHENEISA
jgi:hypothetical protein